MMQCGENTDMMVELIGTLVYIPTDKWQEVMTGTGILEFLQSQFMNGYAEDDVILECVMLCGTMCRNDDCAQIIANSYLIRLLQDMLGAKQEDDEMVQQILNTFFKFLFFAPTRELVLTQTQMVSIVLELLSDKNPNIRVLVNAILDYVQAHDDTWRQEIKTKRFYAHNQVFMQLFDEMEKQYPVGGGMGGPDYDMYDEMYYDQAAMMQAQQQQEYYGEEDEDGMQGLYVEGLADRIWEDEQQE
jgi:AcrR family transcriptional regulator